MRSINNSRGTAYVTLLYHINALRRADERFHAERDRRYTENAALRAEALNIKGMADAKALELQALNQAYKDEKANNLRDQIGAERGLYPTKSEMGALGDKFTDALKPLTQFMTAQQSRSTGIEKWVPVILSVMMSLLIAGIAIAAIVYRGHTP